jgi:hypothetical protein
MKTSKRIRWVSLFVLATTILYSRVSLAQTSSQAGATADIPRTLSYQGVLQSSDGQPINGEEPMTIRLYADTAGQNLVWEDTYTANVQNGIFNLLLGSQNPLPADQQMDAPLWVAVKIGEAEEMKPYAPLSASPYALAVANGSITADKIAADYVSSIYVNGTKVTGNGSALNLMAGNGLSLSYDPVSSAIWLSAAGGGNSSGKGDQTLSTKVRTFNGRSGDVVSVNGDYDFSQISGAVNLTSQVSGTLPVAKGGIGVTTASANKVFAGPTSGGAAAPSFRSLAASDIPTLNQNTTGTAANVTGTVAVANGGTGSTTASANKVFAGPTSGGAAAPSFRTLAVSDIPTLNQNTTGTAANVTGTVAVANGGTGTTTALTQGSIVFAGASGVYSQDNSKLFWDETNHRLGIGTSAPAQALEVAGNVKISGALMPNASAGTTGQVLVSNGANTAPSWQNASTTVLSKIVSTQATAPTLSTNDATNITALTLSTKATDAAGMISFTTNGSETMGDYVQLTFNANTTQPVVIISPANEAASIGLTQEIYVVATGGSPGNFQITLGSLWADAYAFDPGQTYSFYYHVIDTQ